MVRNKQFKKKGSIVDLLGIGVSLVVLGLTVLIVFKVYSSFNTGFAEQTTNVRALQSNAEMEGLYTGIIDNSFLFLFIGLSIITLILASLVRIHPVFFVFYFFVLVIIIFLGGVMSNIYLEVANNANFIEEANKLTFISHILGRLPFLIGVLGFILSVIMYKNWSESG
jgi:hypothetical protein